MYLFLMTSSLSNSFGQKILGTSAACSSGVCCTSRESTGVSVNNLSNRMLLTSLKSGKIDLAWWLTPCIKQDSIERSDGDETGVPRVRKRVASQEVCRRKVKAMISSFYILKFTSACTGLAIFYLLCKYPLFGFECNLIQA